MLFATTVDDPLFLVRDAFDRCRETGRTRTELREVREPRAVPFRLEREAPRRGRVVRIAHGPREDASGIALDDDARRLPFADALQRVASAELGAEARAVVDPLAALELRRELRGNRDVGHERPYARGRGVDVDRHLDRRSVREAHGSEATPAVLLTYRR